MKNTESDLRDRLVSEVAQVLEDEFGSSSDFFVTAASLREIAGRVVDVVLDRTSSASDIER